MMEHFDELDGLDGALMRYSSLNLLDSALDKSLREGRIENISGNGDGLTTGSIDVSGNLFSLA
jgi:hypothetical protein